MTREIFVEWDLKELLRNESMNNVYTNTCDVNTSVSLSNLQLVKCYNRKFLNRWTEYNFSFERTRVRSLPTAIYHFRRYFLLVHRIVKIINNNSKNINILIILI